MKNSQYLDTIYNDVKALGLVDNQCDFSMMCGRTPAWFSAVKARGLPMTTDASLTLSSNIAEQAKSILDPIKHESAVALSSRLIIEAQSKIMRKQRLLRSVEDAIS